MRRDGTTTMITAIMGITAVTAATALSIALRTTSIFALVRQTLIPVCGSCVNVATRRAFTGVRGAMTNAAFGSTEAAAPILKLVVNATVVIWTGNSLWK